MVDLDPTTSLLVGAVIVIIVAIVAWLLSRAAQAQGAEVTKQHPDVVPTGPTAHCPSCNSVVASQATECDHCGAAFEPDTFDCPSCKAEIEHGAERCESCGETFHYGSDYTCPACHAEVAKSTKECPHCGKKIWSTLRKPRATGGSDATEDS